MLPSARIIHCTRDLETGKYSNLLETKQKSDLIRTTEEYNLGYDCSCRVI